MMLRCCHFRGDRGLKRDCPDPAGQGRVRHREQKGFIQAQGKQNMRQPHHIFNEIHMRHCNCAAFPGKIGEKREIWLHCK